MASEREHAAREASNVLAQFDFVVEVILRHVKLEEPYRLTAQVLRELNHLAMTGLEPGAGEFRPGRMIITNSEHRPPSAEEVPALVDEMCAYVNSNWKRTSAVHLSAYVMWRLNWIHPFSDGNGRTSRAAGYLVLCVRLGYLLPGSETVPAMIAQNKRRYHEALEDCDAPWRGGRLDVRPMERLIEGYLVRQLASGLDSPQ